MLTFDQAHELFRYNDETGKLYWKVNRTRKAAGREAGWTNKHGRTYYRRVEVDGKAYQVHRVIWLMIYGRWPFIGIDHRDGNGLNNRRYNIREATCDINLHNARMYRTNKSGVTGVYYDRSRQKWRAEVTSNQKTTHIGRFNDITEAEKARKQAAREHGFTERHGVAE